MIGTQGDLYRRIRIFATSPARLTRHTIKQHIQQIESLWRSSILDYLAVSLIVDSWGESLYRALVFDWRQCQGRCRNSPWCVFTRVAFSQADGSKFCAPILWPEMCSSHWLKMNIHPLSITSSTFSFAWPLKPSVALWSRTLRHYGPHVRPVFLEAWREALTYCSCAGLYLAGWYVNPGCSTVQNRQLSAIPVENCILKSCSCMQTNQVTALFLHRHSISAMFILNRGHHHEQESKCSLCTQLAWTEVLPNKSLSNFSWTVCLMRGRSNINVR